MTLFKCSPLKITRHRDKHCSLQAPLNGRFPVLPFRLRPRPLKARVIKSGAKWPQHTAFRAKWVPIVFFFYLRPVLLKFDSEALRKQTCGMNRWKFTEWSFIWKRRGVIKKLFLAFWNVYLACMCAKMKSQYLNALIQPLLLQCKCVHEHMNKALF